MTPSELRLSREEMQAFGYRIVDFLVDHFDGLPGRRVTARADRQTLAAKLDHPFPERGLPLETVLGRIEDDVFGNMMHIDHPRFFAFVPGPGNFVGAMADALVSGLNVFQGTWLASSGPSTVELVTIDWLREACGLPPAAGGLFLSGGSMANITGLALARHVHLGNRIERAIVYLSDQTHSSVERGLRLLGLAPDQIHKLPSDAEFRLPVPDLERAIVSHRAAGRRPFCVVANAGTTNTGAVDPLPALADLCRVEGLWLHVDGAYGAAAALCEEGRRALAGIERADSLSLDPHKWLFQPLEIGCVLVRDVNELRDAFRILPEYMQDAHRLREFNFCDHGVQLTRAFRALKLWMSLQVFGVAAFREAVARGFELARLAERLLRELPAWEIVTPAQMGIVSFRRRASEAVNQALVGRMFEDGFAFLTSTVLRGRTVLRLCTINPRTTEEDIRETIQRLDRVALADE